MHENLFFDLLIVDDIYPSTFSPFRTLEYNHYLWFFNSAALSLEGWHLWVENNNFDEHLSGLDERLRSRVFRYATHSQIAARLAYVTFLKNAVRLLPYFESRQLPFILQLYPGAGFAIDVEESDAELRTVLLHPLCRKVITTQTITRNYVLEKIGCDPRKVEFIFGGVFDSGVDFDFARDKKLYGRDKDTIDLCFVAHKYGNDISSKGYDYFVELAKRLRPKFDNLRFHVVGNYDANDIDLGTEASAFTFYGRQPQSFFADFYPRMDAIVSFNRPFVLAPGTFDGFPTGACLEAAFRGVANFVNDPLGLNVEFQDGRDLVLLDDDFDTSVKQIEDMLADPPKLATLGEGSSKAFRRVMDIDRQLWARTKIIVDELHKHEALVLVPTAPASRLEARDTPDPEVEALKRANRAHEGHVTDLLRHINSLEKALATRAGLAAPEGPFRRRLRSLKQIAKWGSR